MHPQAFLKTFWRMELRPQIFVAMDFSPEYKKRFDDVVVPAVKSIKLGDTSLEAYRVDISKSGDSILTDIVDGIAHSQLVLADVSVIEKGARTSKPYRNGNVMYEVGVALSCRHSSEVLLIHDGISNTENFLFDVSTIPHKKIDFSNTQQAIAELSGSLFERLKERNHIHDARVQLAIAGLSAEELRMLKDIAGYSLNHIWGFKDDGHVNFVSMSALPRLLDKQLIELVGEFEEGHPAYKTTPLGKVAVESVNVRLKKFKADPKLETTTEDSVQKKTG